MLSLLVGTTIPLILKVVFLFVYPSLPSHRTLQVQVTDTRDLNTLDFLTLYSTHVPGICNRIV